MRDVTGTESTMERTTAENRAGSIPQTPDRGGEIFDHTDISQEARAHVRRNFGLIAASHALSNLGDHLINPKTVLTWLMASVGAPAALVALLVPIRESGSMVLQVFLAGLLARLRRRKGAWIAGSLLQALAVLGMGLTAALAAGTTAGWLILLLLAVFSLSRGLNSVASKDVLGKTIPKGRRGRVTGFGTAISGVAAAILGVVLWATGESASTRLCVVMLLAAGLLWTVAAAVYANVREPASEPPGGPAGFVNPVQRFGLLRTDPRLRRFLLARALLLCSALSAPYYMLLAQERQGVDLQTLGSFILANALASGLSSAVWGLMADLSSRRVMLCAGTLTVVLGFAVAAVAAFDTPLGNNAWTYAVAFFLLGIAHNGMRLGRKTYIVDMATADLRMDYVAVSNTAIGVVLLLTGLLTPLVSIIGPTGMILLLTAFGLFGVVTAARLPEVE